VTDQQHTSNDLVTRGSHVQRDRRLLRDDRNAYNALTLLKELDSQQRLEVREAVVVVRGEDGQVIEKDRIESTFLPGTAGGGLTGLLIGIIAGPLGVLIGGPSGLFAGSLFDLYDMDETDSQISGSVRPGHAALLAVVSEQSREVVDVAMSNLGGTVVRRSVDDVEAEVAAAEKAQRKAKAEARKELARSRHEHNKAAVNAKVADLKAKLHHEEKTPVASGD
jgi:uncharacterized membrane protein